MADRSKLVFEMLVRENEGMLISYLRTLVRDDALVEDLLQETFIEAWKNFDAFDASRPLAPWLRGIALNLVRNTYRKQSRSPMQFTDQIAVIAEQTFEKIHQLSGDSWDEKIESLRACMERLPQSSRELLQLRYTDQKLAPAIAAALDTSSEAIRKKLQRVRQALIECMQRRIPGLFAEANS